MGSRPVADGDGGRDLHRLLGDLRSPGRRAAVDRGVLSLRVRVPPLALLVWWERRRFGPLARRALSLSLVAGIFFMADLVFYHHAIAAVGAGSPRCSSNVQVVIVPLAAWAFVREKPPAGRSAPFRSSSSGSSSSPA